MTNPAARADAGRIAVTLDGAVHQLDLDDAHLLIDQVQAAIRDHLASQPS